MAFGAGRRGIPEERTGSDAGGSIRLRSSDLRPERTQVAYIWNRTSFPEDLGTNEIWVVYTRLGSGPEEGVDAFRKRSPVIVDLPHEAWLALTTENAAGTAESYGVWLTTIGKR